MGQILEPHQLTPADVQASFLDNQVHLSRGQFLGRLKFLGCLHEKVTCFDSHFLCNLDLAEVLEQEDYSYIRDGILSVILRKETKVAGQFLQVRDLDHLHEIWKNEPIRMYKDPTTKDPEQKLKLNGYYSKLVEAFQDKAAITVRNPSVQPQFQELSERLLESDILRRLGIKREWRKAVTGVKQEIGYIPGRKELYREIRQSASRKELRKVTNWIYYTSMWNTVAPSSSIDYPPTVFQVQSIAETLALKQATVKTRFLGDLKRKISGIFDLSSIARVPYTDFLEIRDRHSEEWWKVCKKNEFDVREMFDVFEPLYGEIVKTSGGRSTKGSVRARFRVVDLGLKVAEAGAEAVGFLLSLKDPLNVVNYITTGAGFSLFFSDFVLSKKDDKRDRAAFGRGALSKIKPSLITKYGAG